MALQTRNVRRNVVNPTAKQHQSPQTEDDVGLSKTTILVRTTSCKLLPRSSMAGPLQGRQGYIGILLWSRWPSPYPPSDHRGKAGGRCSLEVS